MIFCTFTKSFYKIKFKILVYYKLNIHIIYISLIIFFFYFWSFLSELILVIDRLYVTILTLSSPDIVCFW